MVCRCPEPVRMARCQNVCNQNLQAPDEPLVRLRVETVRDRICMETKNTSQRRNTRFRTDGKGKGETETGEGGWMRRQKRNDNLGKQAWRYGVRYGMSDGKQTLETRTSQLHISEGLGYRGCGLPTPHRNVFEILEKRIRWRAQRQAPTSPALALHAHSATPASCCWAWARGACEEREASLRRTVRQSRGRSLDLALGSR
jgi:hypothetical protein